MSGICGFSVGAGAASARSDLHRMFGVAPHLGPDGTLTYVDASIALGQFLDWQTPEATKVTAPVSGTNNRVVLVADVRLDNRERLSDLLEVDRSLTLTWSDEELLLACFEQRGIDFVEDLLGDFFFAIWDSSVQTLWLVRDQLGMRPAYYYPTEHGVVFGTEVRVIAAHPDFVRKVCRTRVADYLGLGFEDDELTFYQGLVRLPPGSLLCVGEGKRAKRKYWELQFSPELRLRDHREYTEQFRSLLIESVTCRLRAHRPVGFLLSGGLDSSSIVGIARKSGAFDARGPIPTFSALFTDYPLIDERSWIDQVIAEGNFEPRFVRVDQRSPLERLAKDIEDHGQPFYAPNNYVDSALLDTAQDAGMRVVIDGLDGDTTVGHGWEFFGEMLRRGKWRRLLRIARELSEHTDKSTFWFIWRHALGPTLLGLSMKLRGRRSIRAPRLMQPHFAEEVGWVDRVWAWRQQRGFDLLSDYRRQHWGKLRSGLMAMCFEIASQQAAARGIVRRHPYFDRRLVEFCVSLPADQRLDRGVDRIIQRRAVEGFTPEAIRTRLTKSIWVQNFADRLALNESQKIERLMLGSRNDSPVAEFVDMSVVGRACRRVLEKRADERTLAEIWVVMALDVWLSRGW